MGVQSRAIRNGCRPLATDGALVTAGVRARPMTRVAEAARRASWSIGLPSLCVRVTFYDWAGQVGPAIELATKLAMKLAKVDRLWRRRHRHRQLVAQAGLESLENLVLALAQPPGPGQVDLHAQRRPGRAGAS